MIRGGPTTWGRRGGLVALFVGVLAGCAGQGEPDQVDPSDGCENGCSCTYDSADVLLSRAEYADWVGDGQVTTGFDPSTGTDGDPGTTGAMATGGEMSTSSTGGGSETGGGTSGDMAEFDAAALTAEICIEVCKHHSGADDWGLECSVPELTPEEKVHIVCTWTTGCE